jgi:hypothetical protein
VGRTIEESLWAVRDLTGLPLPIVQEDSGEEGGETKLVLGRRFWTAFIRGGYQGAVYLADTLFPDMVRLT